MDVSIIYLSILQDQVIKKKERRIERLEKEITGLKEEIQTAEKNEGLQRILDETKVKTLSEREKNWSGI